MVGARRGSPLIIGIGDDENFLTSDANAIVAHTRQVVYLNDYDVATVTRERFDVQSLGDGHRQRCRSAGWNSPPRRPSGALIAHFMLKEIFEQPRAVENALRGRIDFEGATARFGGLNMTAAELRSIERIVIGATGTSWHAALVGEYLDRGTGPPARGSRIQPRILLPQRPACSATPCCWSSPNPAKRPTRWRRLREAKRRGHRALAIINVVGSTIARESDGGIYMHAGPEIGVASTKAFVSTLTILTLLAVHLGRMRMLSASRAAGDPARARSRARRRSNPSLPRTPPSRNWPSNTPGRRFLFPGPRLHFSRSPWKARSSSRKFPTSTPKAIPPPR